jgi:hypothetical protein
MLPLGQTKLSLCHEKLQHKLLIRWGVVAGKPQNANSEPIDADYLYTVLYGRVTHLTMTLLRTTTGRELYCYANKGWTLKF